MPDPAETTATEPAEPAGPARYVVPALLLLLTAAVFGNVLFATQPAVLSNRNGDLFLQFMDWRAFGFGELRHGRLALWNPHLFSGAPFFGGFQAALLYPPNWLFLVLPVPVAVNWSIALHVFLAGLFTHLWARRRGLRPAASFLAAVIFMFGGAYFPHIYAGHLPNLCAMVWAPLLFLAMDGWEAAPAPGWILLGMAAAAMQILAGHPQYVFYTGVAAVVYGGLGLFQNQRPARYLLGLAAMAAGGAALSAVQLFTALQESHETLRSLGLSFETAQEYSFPPENVLTLMLPDFFGNARTGTYWGRWCWWEMSSFISAGGLVLAVGGAFWGSPRARRFSVVMAGGLLLLALGSNTPLFEILFDLVPGFDKFRGSSKFIFLAVLFLALLAGIGFDELLKGRRPPRVFAAAVAGAGLVLLGVACVVWPANASAAMTGWLHSAMLAVRSTGELIPIYMSPARYDDPGFVLHAGQLAAHRLLLGAGMLFALAALLLGLRRFRPAVWLLLALTVVDLLFFAEKSLDQFEPGAMAEPAVTQYLARHPGDYRILNLQNPNRALSLGTADIWGYDPGVLLRYSQLVGFTQGVSPDSPTPVVPFSHIDRLFQMLRFRVAFLPKKSGGIQILESTNGLPQLLLVSHCRVLSQRDDIFAALTDSQFDPRQEVILESPPDPAPEPASDAGTVRLTDSTPDRLTIEADVPSPRILLVTDAYAEGWRARALAGSVQSNYQVLPANWCLRAIPLKAGHHSLCLEYVPAGFILGKWVSLVSLAAFLVMGGWLLLRPKPHTGSSLTGVPQ